MVRLDPLLINKPKFCHQLASWFADNKTVETVSRHNRIPNENKVYVSILWQDLGVGRLGSDVGDLAILTKYTVECLLGELRWCLIGGCHKLDSDSVLWEAIEIF